MKAFLSIKELRLLLDQKEVSAHEVASFYRARLRAHNPSLNAALELYDDGEQHQEFLDGPLGGIPGLLKDNISYKGHTASCGSKILANYKAPYNATVTDRAKKAGGIILGRTNMDEFAMGSSGENSAYGPSANPWDVQCTPGGSSCGSAAAVAAGLVPWALGSETGGSVRQPAAFTGLVGLYPTYGLIPRYGLVAFASSTDQVGPLTKTVYDNALLTSVLAGHDPKDATSLPEPARDYTRLLNGELPAGLKIGVLKEALESPAVDAEIKVAFQDAIKQLERLGASIRYISLETLKYGISVYYIIAPAEASSNLSRYDGTLYGNRKQGNGALEEMYLATRHDGFGPEVKRRILLGNYVLSAGHQDAYYRKALMVRSMIRAEYDAVFKDVNLMISPTTPMLPFKFGEKSNDPLAMYMADYFTVTNCIAGYPALSLPCGYSKNNLPIGFQFMGPRLSEELMYQVAYAYEQSTDFHTRFPAGYE
jgi:aspartyl-tRNA(Asn)/glutamyl-tRNA(Gln) amidotransferase subunit A